LDDLHWADTATVAWLGYLIRNISSPSLHLLATSRPLEKQVDLIKLLQVLKREDRFIRLQLSVLTESAMQKIAAVLSEKQNDQFSSWLIKNAEGNPFFVTELVRYAQRIGLLKKDGSLDQELLDLSPAIPATIQNLIESRLLKLSEKARYLLHVAAIIGREFDFELAKQVASFSETDTLDAVEELQATHLIKPLLDDKFIFDHSLTMQVALSDMNETRRRFLHRRVAETLEEVFRNDLDPVTGLIAHHFVEGNVPDRAKLFSVRAGQLASNLAAWAEALTFYQQALVLETVEAERASIFLEMGTAHVHMGEFALATKDFHSAVELAQASKNWQLLEDAHLGFIQSLVPQARYVEALEASKKLCESGPPELAVCAEFSFGASLSINSGKPEEAEHHLREAERLLQDRAGGVVTKITSLQIKYHLGAVLGQQGRIEEAVAMYREVLDSIQRDEGKLDTFRNIMLYNHLAYYAHLLGDASAAMYAQTGIKLAQEKGSLSHLSSFYSTLGEIALAKGELDTAENHFLEGLKIAEQTPIPVHVAGLTANLGLVAKARGQDDVAREQLQKALNLVQSLGDRHLEVRIRIWLAPLLAEEDAHASLSSARVLAEQGGLKGLLEEIGKMEKELSR
jgi:tetratricopeptide (TPR) repeat protein